jgi:hypothetical protein
MMVGLGEKVELEVLVPFPWLKACQVPPTALEALISRASSVSTPKTPKCQTLQNHPKMPANGTIALALGTLGRA